MCPPCGRAVRAPPNPVYPSKQVLRSSTTQSRKSAVALGCQVVRHFPPPRSQQRRVPSHLRIPGCLNPAVFGPRVVLRYCTVLRFGESSTSNTTRRVDNLFVLERPRGSSCLISQTPNNTFSGAHTAAARFGLRALFRVHVKSGSWNGPDSPAISSTKTVVSQGFRVRNEGSWRPVADADLMRCLVSPACARTAFQSGKEQCASDVHCWTRKLCCPHRANTQKPSSGGTEDRRPHERHELWRART